MPLDSLETSELLSLVNILVAVVVAVVTWLITWWTLRAQITRKRLSYFMKMTPIITHDFSEGRGELHVTFNGEDVDKLVLLEVDIKNTGNTPIEDPPIQISSEGGVYLIPGYFEDVPPGYDDLWEIMRLDGEDSLIKLQHINPGQVAKVRFVLDNLPASLPAISCPMPGLVFNKSVADEFKPVAELFADAFVESFPMLRPIRKALRSL